MGLIRCTSRGIGHPKLVGVRSTRTGSERGYGANTVALFSSTY